jgi:hypothetical protein
LLRFLKVGFMSSRMLDPEVEEAPLY